MQIHALGVLWRRLTFFFMSSGLKSSGSLSPDLVVALDVHVLECYLGHC